LYYFFHVPLTLLCTITSSWCGRFDTPVYKTQQYLTRACRCNCSNFLKSKLKVKVNKKLELSFTHILVATFYVRPRFIDNHDKTSYPVKDG
jgi:hypothetical protein